MKVLTSVTMAAALALIFPVIAGAQNSNVQLRTADKPSLGKYLTNASGRALYMFTSDKHDTSTCNDSCAQVWPPLLAAAKPAAGPGVTASKLGVTRRKDGRDQVTYNGMPLYYFAKDQGPGTTAGEGVHEMGGEWYLVSPAGDKIDND